MIRTFLLSFVLFAFTFNVHAQECSTETDEFTGANTVQCEVKIVEIENEGEETMYRAGASVIKTEGRPFLLVAASSESWNFLGEDKAYTRINGEARSRRMSFVDRDTNTDGGFSVYEVVAVELESEDLETIANSPSEFRIKIGQTVLGLSGAGLDSQASFVLNN